MPEEDNFDTVAKKENVIVRLSFEFALDIIKYADLLDLNRKYVLSKQILKSGTSIGANVREAQNAESKSDFVHKMKIAAKEAEEVEYWLLLCKHSEVYPECDLLLQKSIVLKKILCKIIASSKTNKNK